jgi:zinc protease
MLAGKSASASPFISNLTHGITASSTPKDLETALQLLYLEFVDPRFDENEFQTGIQQIKAILPNIANNPAFILQNEMNKILYGNSPRVIELNEQTLANADLATIERVYRELFKDAAGARLTITGNVNPEEIKPLVEKYIGSIAKGKKADKVNLDNFVDFAKGQIDEVVRIPMETPKSTVLQLYSAYMPVDTKTEVALAVANYVLDMIYTKTIREEEGGTYGVGTAMVGQRLPIERVLIQVQFDTNPEMAEKLAELAKKGLKELAENGPELEKFNMAIENFKKNLPESRISNSYWAGNIATYNHHGIDYDAEYEAAVNSITPADVKAVLQAVLAQNNLIEITSAPKE